MRARSFVKNYLNYTVVAAAAVICAVLSATGAFSMQMQFLLEKITIAVILAISLSMVVGFLGELSLGHAGFMCVGAFIGGKVASLLSPALGGEDSILVLLIALVVGGGIAALFGFIIGLPALRLRGDYLAIVTLAFGEIVRTVIMNLPSQLFGGTLGLKTPRFDRKYLFIIGFIFVLICLAVTQNLIKSRHGRAITSIRDNEIAARAMGIDITKYKLLVFTISAFFAGIAGVLYSYTQSSVQSATFDYNYSIEILVMVVLGGMGSINGSLIAATLITYIKDSLQTVLTGNLAVLQDLLFAIILIVFVIYRNAPSLKNTREKLTIENLKAARAAKKAAKAQKNTEKEDG